MLIFSFSYLLLLLFLLAKILIVPFFIYLERRLLGVFQLRLGLFIYFFQSFFIFIADFLKVLSKFDVMVLSLNFFLLFFCGLAFFLLSLFLLFFFPNYSFLTFFYYNYFVFLLIFFFSIIPFIFCLFSFSSNSLFSLLGNLRFIISVVSVELVIILLLIMVFFFQLPCHLYYLTGFLLAFLVFLVAIHVDCSRVPFDLIEGESDLVSGFNTEFGLIIFLLVFFSEYVLFIFFILLVKLSLLTANIILFLLFIYFLISRALFVRVFFSFLIFIFWFHFLLFLSCYFVFYLLA